PSPHLRLVQQPLATLSHQQASMPSSAAVSAFALLVLAAICMAQCSASQHSDVMVDRYIRKCGYDLVRTMWKVCSRRGVAVKRGSSTNLSPAWPSGATARLPELQCLIKQEDVVYHCCCNWCKLSYLELYCD
uniref:IlGF domain-containing protein n=1 Tax=Macrostomum lignano TaxID=282301 RepID=A0A1I8FHM1_9PLAT